MVDGRWVMEDFGLRGIEDGWWMTADLALRLGVHQASRLPNGTRWPTMIRLIRLPTAT
jgi:hypothetical protein